MGDHKERPVLALLLEALVASVLIGTFFVYAYPNSGPAAMTAPGELARLAPPR